MSPRAPVRPAKPERHLTPIERTVYEAIVDVSALDLDEITADARLVEDLNLDSLDLIELSMDLEQQCGIAIGDHVVDDWPTATVKDIVAEIEKLKARA